MHRASPAGRVCAGAASGMLHRYDMAAAALSNRHGTIQAPPPRCQNCQCDESAQPQATQSCRVTRSAGGDPRALGLGPGSDKQGSPAC